MSSIFLKEYLGFLQSVCDSIAGKKLSECKTEETSTPVKALLALMDR